jgi:predicted ABC-type transport system involved in lysophospholipase L1 biosynthesis ATPase subunit
VAVALGSGTQRGARLVLRPGVVVDALSRGDGKAADGVFELMREVNRDSGTSFLLVTHNLDLARRCDRIIEVVDGRLRA